MKQKFLFSLRAVTMLLVMCLSIGNVWGSTDVTYSFTSKSWASNPANGWTKGADGAGYQNNGVQFTATSTSGYATSSSSYSNISKIKVSYCTNGSSGAGSIKIKIGDNDEQSQSVTKTGGTTARDVEFSYSTAQSGKVKISASCTANSIYIKGITITYSPGTPLGIPANLSSSASSVSATLNWDPVDNAQGYKVKIGSNEYDASSTSYVATGLEPETQYTWSVKALSGTSQSYSDGDYAPEKQFSTTAFTPTAGTYSIIPNNVFWGKSTQDGSKAVTANTSFGPGTKYGVSISMNSGTSTNSYMKSDHCRVYAGYTVTISAPLGFKFTSITFTGSTWVTPTANVGVMNSKAWTGNATSVVFTFTSTSYMSNIELTYVAAGPTTYSVTYECNGATSGCPDPAQVSEQTELPNPLPTLTKTGYTFGGWFTDDQFQNEAEAGATLSANTTLYAKWTGTQPTISTQPQSANYNKGVAATALNVEASISTGGSLGYQWRESADQSAWSNIQDAASNSYTPSTAIAGTKYYRCVVSNSTASVSVNSNVATITVISLDPTVSLDITSMPDKVYGDAPVTITPTAQNFSGTPTFTWESSNTNAATVADGVVTFVGQGTSQITCTGKYDTEEASAYCNVVVSRATQTVSFNNPTTSVIRGSKVTNVATTTGNGTITYTSGTTANATVGETSGEVTGVAVGSSVITANAAETDQYAAASANYTITVNPKQFTLKWYVVDNEYTEGTPSSSVNENTKISTLPTAPEGTVAGSCATTFMGWSTTNMGSQLGQSAPSVLFKTAADSPTITESMATEGIISFYAIFASEE